MIGCVSDLGKCDEKRVITKQLIFVFQKRRERKTRVDSWPESYDRPTVFPSDAFCQKFFQLGGGVCLKQKKFLKKKEEKKNT
jgi:hypothetical protein